jgi:hypothetical protein
MTVSGGCRGSGWFVTPGADVYANDVYERPTMQTFTASGGVFVASEYLGYLDLVTAQYGYDSEYAYFQLNLFSRAGYKSDGTVDSEVFGSGTNYGVQLGINGDPGTLLLRGEQDKNTVGQAFTPLKTQGWYDANNSVGGPGGVGTPNEEDLISNFNGYESQLANDGRFTGTSQNVLFSRSFYNANGTATVELALNYIVYNQMCADSNQSTPACPLLNPAALAIVFETTRGLKDNQNYLWNDKYNSSEAGSPYSAPGLGNIYELDNMRVGFQQFEPIPEPATLGLLSLGIAGIAARCRRRRGR